MLLSKADMRQLSIYLRQNHRSIALYVFAQIFFSGAWLLYHNSEIMRVLYPVMVTTFIGLTGLVIGYMRHIRKIHSMENAYRYVERNNRGPDDLNIVTDQHAEAILIAIANELMAKFKTLEESYFLNEKDRESYYALWSHQIKTPITSLKLLLEEMHDEDDFLARRYQMLEEILKIEQYMEMILHYNRIGDMSKDLEIEEVALQKVVHHVLKKFSILFINRRFKIVVEVPEVMVISDKKWLTLVIEQILSNAIKYTESGSITIRAVQQGDSVQLIVEDTGIGIRAEDIERVFEKGFTGYNGRLDQRASGIGLFLVKKVMDQLNHTIKIKSELGEGTQVVLGFGNLTKM